MRTSVRRENVRRYRIAQRATSHIELMAHDHDHWFNNHYLDVSLTKKWFLARRFGLKPAQIASIHTTAYEILA